MTSSYGTNNKEDTYVIYGNIGRYSTFTTKACVSLNNWRNIKWERTTKHTCWMTLSYVKLSWANTKVKLTRTLCDFITILLICNLNNRSNDKNVNRVLRYNTVDIPKLKSQWTHHSLCITSIMSSLKLKNPNFATVNLELAYQSTANYGIAKMYIYLPETLIDTMLRLKSQLSFWNRLKVL